MSLKVRGGGRGQAITCVSPLGVGTLLVDEGLLYWDYVERGGGIRTRHRFQQFPLGGSSRAVRGLKKINSLLSQVGAVKNRRPGARRLEGSLHPNYHRTEKGRERNWTSPS